MVELSPLAEMRENYTAGQLVEQEVASSPFVQFESWFAEAQSAGLYEPNAMTVVSVSPDGQPSARMVLLKGFSEDGLVFYTHYHSRKAREMLATQKVAAVFFWGPLERQVRIEGDVHKADPAVSDAYFASRPRGSQLGAHVSPQSEVIPDRDYLVQRQAQLEAQFEGRDIPRPEDWGGLVIVPRMFEFWQGRPSRLHDRIRYDLQEQNWYYQRLAP